MNLRIKQQLFNPFLHLSTTSKPPFDPYPDFATLSLLEGALALGNVGYGTNNRHEIGESKADGLFRMHEKTKVTWYEKKYFF